MTRDISELQSEQFVQDLTQNEYYKKIQKQLKEKQAKKENQKTPDTSLDMADQQKNKDTSNKLTQTNLRDLFTTKDKATIRSLDWEQNNEGTFELNAETQKPVKTSVDIKTDAKQIRSLLGIKIDFNSKIDSLQENYMQSVIQSRSHNFFLSKYAQFKLGLIGQILSLMGISQVDIKKLKTKAINDAIDENIRLMTENIYNTELTEIVYGQSRKVRESQKLFTEIKSQLTQQMHQLGKEAYWSELKFLEEEATQCKKIREEFLKEKMALDYQLTFVAQDIVTNE